MTEHDVSHTHFGTGYRKEHILIKNELYLYILQMDIEIPKIINFVGNNMLGRLAKKQPIYG